MAVETETLTITLPLELVQHIRERVAAGEYASESEAIAAKFQSDSYAWLPDEPFDGMSDADWDAEVQRRIEALDRGEEKTYSLDEVMQRLHARRAEFLQA